MSYHAKTKSTLPPPRLLDCLNYLYRHRLSAMEHFYGTTDTLICVLATIVIIAITIWLVNLRTHHEKLFEHRLQFSPIQKIILFTATIFFIISYVLNGNIDDLVGIYHSSWHVTLIVTTVAISAGFLEEYLTRGYLFNLCQRLLNHYHVTTCPLLIASLFNSLIFGSLHLMNYFLGGQGLTATLQQVFLCDLHGVSIFRFPHCNKYNLHWRYLAFPIGLAISHHAKCCWCLRLVWHYHHFSTNGPIEYVIYHDRRSTS